MGKVTVTSLKESWNKKSSSETIYIISIVVLILLSIGLIIGISVIASDRNSLQDERDEYKSKSDICDAALQKCQGNTTIETSTHRIKPPPYTRHPNTETSTDGGKIHFTLPHRHPDETSTDGGKIHFTLPHRHPDETSTDGGKIHFTLPHRHPDTESSTDTTTNDINSTTEFVSTTVTDGKILPFTLPHRHPDTETSTERGRRLPTLPHRTPHTTVSTEGPPAE